MLNKRMIAIAAALLMFFPVGVLAGPAQDTVEAGADLVLEVKNLVVADPTYERDDPVDWDLVRPEQLVEGHTVFVTIETTGNVTVQEWNVTVDGHVECRHHGEIKGSWWNGVPFVTGAEHVRVECHVGERVVFTPSVYCIATGDPTCPNATPSLPMVATGVILPFTTPTGEQGYVEELSFVNHETDAWGHPVEKTYYAYATPVFAPWITDEGQLQNFRTLIPVDRLREMQVSDWEVFAEENVPRA